MNHFRKHLCNWFVVFVAFSVPGVTHADVITEWNETALACTTAAKQPGFAAPRSMAMVHTAMFDAVNSIEGGYAPYKVKEPASPGSSSEAAAAAAAHAVLINLFPSQNTD